MSAQTPVLSCHILDTGYCLARENHILQGGSRRKIACHSLVALLRHPEHGWLLWDTGYAPRMYLERGRAICHSRSIAPPRRCICVRTGSGSTTGASGHEAREIRRVLISHFHADHIAGLRGLSRR